MPPADEAAAKSAAALAERGNVTDDPHDESAEEGEEAEEGADEEEAEEEGGEEEGKKKKKRKSVRKRRSATDLNLLRDPSEVIVELTEPVLQELAGARKLHQLRYPTYIVCTHENFQLRAIEGLAAIKGTALKELDLSLNKLMVRSCHAHRHSAISCERLARGAGRGRERERAGTGSAIRLAPGMGQASVVVRAQMETRGGEEL